MLDQGGGDLSARKPYREAIAQTKHGIVPASIERGNLQVCQIGVLILEQPANEGGIDSDFGIWRLG